MVPGTLRSYTKAALTATLFVVAYLCDAGSEPDSGVLENTTRSPGSKTGWDWRFFATASEVKRVILATFKQRGNLPLKCVS
jgi:hypothetical protein